MGSKWSLPEVQQWKKDARDTQQLHSSQPSCRNWQVYKPSELHCRIASVCFGYPANYADSDDDLLSGYEQAQQDKAKKIGDAVVKTSKIGSSVKVSFIFVCGKIDGLEFEEPVVRVCKEEKSNGEVVFIDTTGREYQSWDDYLSNNVLPECIYCYPTNGHYCFCGAEGKTVEVSYRDSPSCGLFNRLKRVLDLLGTVGTGMALGITVISTIMDIDPAIARTAAVVGKVSTVYGGARALGFIVDRRMHAQNISLSNPDARAAWFSLLGAVFGVTWSNATAYMIAGATSGEVLGKFGRIAVDTLHCGNLAVNGFGLLNNCHHLVDKYKRGDLSLLECLHFSASVFFFTHGLVRMKTASTIIIETQEKQLSKYKSALTESHYKAFRTVLKETQKGDLMHGNAHVIKGINVIKDHQKFYNRLQQMLKEAPDGTRLKLTPEGLIFVNEQLKIHPIAFIQMSPDNRIKAFKATQQLANQAITQSDFLYEVRSVHKDERITFEIQRKEYTKKVAEAFGVHDLKQVRINGKAMFRDLQPFELDRVASVLKIADGNYDPKIVEAAKLFAESQGCDNPMQFCSLVEFIREFCFRTAEYRSDMSWDAKKQQFIDTLTDSRSENFTRLNQKYMKLIGAVSAINEMIPFAFESNKIAATSFYTSRVSDGGNRVLPQQYFIQASTLFLSGANQSIKMTQEGQSLEMVYIDGKQGLIGVLERPFRVPYNAGLFMKTMYYDKRYHATT